MTRSITISPTLMDAVLKELKNFLVFADLESPFRAQTGRRVKDLIHELERRRDRAAGKKTP